MSLITTAKCGNRWVRYFVVETEPNYGEVPSDDSEPDWEGLDLLMDSFPGKVSENIEINVPSPVIDYLMSLLYGHTFENQASITQAALDLTRDCPIDLERLAKYLTTYVDIGSIGEYDADVTGGTVVNLYKAYYNVAPSLLELTAFKTSELGLTQTELDQILGKEQAKKIKRKTRLDMSKATNPADLYQMYQETDDKSQ